jgi:glycosyltransferase involved in cell wall biosynthesis
MTSVSPPAVKRIAVVFESFVRAGSQRHLVEIMKGIRLFKPELECRLFLIASTDHNWNSFLPEMQLAEISVTCLPYVYDRDDRPGIRARLHNWWSRRHRERSLNAEFYSQLSSFETVVCAQPFVADLLLPNLDAHQRLCFHLMEHLAQRSNISHYGLLPNRRLNLIYMHSSQIAQLPKLRNPNPTITWPVRLCPDHLTDSYPTIENSSETLRIAHYSRISPMRLIDQLINAFALLHQRQPARLRIAGFIEDTTYHKSLLDQILSLGLADAVQFVDPVPSPAEDPARSEVDLVWMISLSGHVGYAGIEAMAAGLPTLLLEVDSQAHTCPLDPALTSLVCATPEQLVERSLVLQDDPGGFRDQQSQLMRERFITTKGAIDDLTTFYLGQL